jgi:hypothetical protein
MWLFPYHRRIDKVRNHKKKIKKSTEKFGLSRYFTLSLYHNQKQINKMKKVLFLLVVLFTITFTASASTTETTDRRPKKGYNYNKMNRVHKRHNWYNNTYRNTCKEYRKNGMH